MHVAALNRRTPDQTFTPSFILHKAVAREATNKKETATCLLLAPSKRISRKIVCQTRYELR